MQHTTISSITKGERGRDIQGRSCTWNDLLLLVIKMGQINAFIFSILMIAVYVNNIICNTIVFLCFFVNFFFFLMRLYFLSRLSCLFFLFFPLPSASLISDKHKINHKLRNSFSFRVWQPPLGRLWWTLPIPNSKLYFPNFAVNVDCRTIILCTFGT